MTLENQRFKHLRAHRDKVSAKAYNRLVDLVMKISRSLFSSGVMDSAGFNTRRPNAIAAGTKTKIFEVQTAATGDGVYNCYEQTLDATEWGDTAGDDKFDYKNSTSIEVLNLLENDPEATYKEMLATGDRIRAQQWRDDEGTLRWVGVPISGGFVRMARTLEAAPADTKIRANLILNNGDEALWTSLGGDLDVYCKISGGGDLNTALPRLADDDYIFVANLQGKWWCTTIFQTSEECDCYSTP